MNNRLDFVNKTSIGRFTMVELMVVIAVILVLMTLLIPALRQAKATALRAVCAGNQRQVSIAMIEYAGDFDDKLCYQTYKTSATNRLRQWPVGYMGSRDNEFTYIVEQYLRIKLKCVWSGYKWMSPDSMDTVLHCPAMKLPCDNPQFESQLQNSHFSYGLYGCTYSREEDLQKNYSTRYTKLARNIKGFVHRSNQGTCNDASKLFLGEILRPTTYYGGEYAYYNMSHNLSGGNFTYPDGRVEWSQRSQMDQLSGTANHNGPIYFPKEIAIYDAIRYYNSEIVITAKIWSDKLNAYINCNDARLVSEFY